MRKFAVLLGLALLVMTAQLAIAEPIDPFNTRPVAIGVSNEPSLQSMLDSFYKGTVNAATDQQSVGMWQLNGQSSATSMLQFEFAGNKDINRFGIWDASDTAGQIHRLDIFKGSANAPTETKIGASATIQWHNGRIFVSGGKGVNASPVDENGDPLGWAVSDIGISNSRFGFYIAVGDGEAAKYYYSVDALNPGGAAQMLAYRDPGANEWFLAFEDSQRGNGGNSDGDFNDMGVSIESITPVPEPASLALLGSGLVSLGGLLRRKRS